MVTPSPCRRWSELWPRASWLWGSQRRRRSWRWTSPDLLSQCSRRSAEDHRQNIYYRLKQKSLHLKGRGRNHLGSGATRWAVGQTVWTPCDLVTSSVTWCLQALLPQRKRWSPSTCLEEAWGHRQTAAHNIEFSTCSTPQKKTHRKQEVTSHSAQGLSRHHTPETTKKKVYLLIKGAFSQQAESFGGLGGVRFKFRFWFQGSGRVSHRCFSDSELLAGFFCFPWSRLRGRSWNQRFDL